MNALNNGLEAVGHPARNSLVFGTDSLEIMTNCDKNRKSNINIDGTHFEKANGKAAKFSKKFNFKVEEIEVFEVE